VECETQTDPGRSSEDEEPDAGRKKPGAPSGAPRNLQKGEGSLQDGDQGGEDGGATEGPVSGKSGGSVGSCVQADHQQEEGSSNAVDDDPGQRGQLRRKPDGNRDGTHPEVLPGG
jgi:hypothetical protein